ncbi:cytochrome P450 4C1-like [Bacillus rossius redtenbacheri]|uniref:cytochrome P450 4C1-like n=1 Tax=Bacillus rossius redtenbacheri TaxID=93214 RepID=UPI002FDCA995
MDVPSIILAAAAIAISSLYLGKLLVRRLKFTRQLAKLPGPMALPLVGTTYLVFFVPMNGILKFMGERIKEFYPIWCTWAGPYPEVNLIKAEHIEKILSGTKHTEKSFLYTFLYPWLGTGLLTSSGNKWHTHRKIITPTFHFKILDNFMEVFSEKSEILVDKLQGKADGKTFDIFPYITRCALDIICETAMGTEIHAQEDVNSEYVRAVYDISEIFMSRVLKPWLHPDLIFYRTRKGRRFAECLGILHGFTKRVIAERKVALSGVAGTNSESSEEDHLIGKKRRKAFLDLLLEVSEQGGRLSDEEIREEVDTFMFEGHDTTAASMSWIILMLALHPEVQEKVSAELDSIFQSSERAATPRDLSEMKYLEQVVKETLRLYPSVPFIQRTASEDVRLDEYCIPAGATFTLQIYFAHRNPESFPDPEQFDPDNFLPERVQGRHPYAYIPFSAGPRNCIGQKFALLEEKIVLSSILRKFKISSTQKIEDIKLLPELVLRPEGGVRVSLAPREPLRA